METSTISTIQTPQSKEALAAKKESKKKAAGADESTSFAQALGGAAIAAPAVNVHLQSKVPQQQNVAAEAGKAGSEPAKLMAGQVVPGGISQLAGHRTQSQLMGTAVESKPLTQKSAVSLNTAQQIAGLKPWDRDWVFAGDEEQNPALKTLLDRNPGIKGGDAGATELQKLQQIEAELATAMKNAAAMNPHASRQQLEQAAAAEVRQAHAAQAQAHGQEGLQAQLSKLNGVLVGAQGQTHRRQDLMAQQPGQPVQGLSGAEFMNALNGIRHPNQGQGQNLGQNPGGEGGSRHGGAFSRPELGGIHDKKERFTLGELGPMGQLQSQIGPHAVVGQHANTVAHHLIPAEVTGHVVKGSMAQDRLSSESLLGMTNHIRSMNSAGGGEMMVRLNPANLGQLAVKVVTNGRDVGLQIQASDHKAKEILEHSMDSLKESLAGQNLTLARVDVNVVGSTHAQHAGDGWQNGQHHAGAGDFLGNFRQDGGQSGNGRGQWSGSSDEPGYRHSAVPRSGLSSMSGLVSGRSSEGRAYAGAGGGMSRLDVMA
jgi:hypothetical protein